MSRDQIVPNKQGSPPGLMNCLDPGVLSHPVDAAATWIRPSLAREKIPHLFDLVTIFGRNENKVVNVFTVAACDILWIDIAIAKFFKIQQLPSLQEKHTVLETSNRTGQPSWGTGVVPVFGFDDKRWAAASNRFRSTRDHRLFMSFNIDLYHGNIWKIITVERSNFYDPFDHH